jgi:hypothetical protein
MLTRWKDSRKKIHRYVGQPPALLTVLSVERTSI